MMLGHSQNDIRMFSPADQTGRQMAFALYPDMDATSKGSSFSGFLCKPTFPPQPWQCHHVPHHPLGDPVPPACARHQENWMDLPPRPSLSAGFTWMGRFICNTSQSGWSMWWPLNPFNRQQKDLANDWHRELGKRGGTCMNRSCGHRDPGMPRAKGNAPSPGYGHPVLQAPAGLPVPGLAACLLSSTAKDCRGSSSTPPAPAPLAPLPSFSQTSPKCGLLLVTAVCTQECDIRGQQDTLGWQAHPWPAAPWSHFSSSLPLLFPLF